MEPSNGGSHGYGQPLQGLQPGSQAGPGMDDGISVGELLAIAIRHARLIAAVTAVTLLVMAFNLGLQVPGYRAEATVMLEADSGSASLEDILGTKKTATAAEIAIIQSRSLAEVVAAPAPLERLGSGSLWVETPADFDPVEDGSAPAYESVGLTTRVVAHDRMPWVGMLARFSGRVSGAHRLRARMSAGSGPASSDLDVHFKDAETLRIAPHDGFLLGLSLIHI